MIFFMFRPSILMISVERRLARSLICNLNSIAVSLLDLSCVSRGVANMPSWPIHNASRLYRYISGLNAKTFVRETAIKLVKMHTVRMAKNRLT